MLFQDFQAHMNDFLTYIDIERNLSKNTQRSYESDLKLFMAFWQKRFQLMEHL